MGRFTGKTCKLISVMGMVVLYFFVELFIGFFIQSLALVADAFHMLSDFIALLVGIVAARLTKMPSSPRNTYGWQRADVVGTLINTVILSTLCFTIVVRAIERFIEVHQVHHPILMVGVGSGGLLINLISICILRHHGHSHGSHVHNYNEVIEVGEDTSLVNPTDPAHDGKVIDDATHIKISENPDISLNHIETEQLPNDHEVSNGPVHDSINNNTAVAVKKASSNHSHNANSMNMKAVLLHVMADALGSVIVVVSALIIYFAPPNSKWVVYVDPGMSLVLVAIIMFSTSKLLYQSALILLQSVPKKVKYSQLKGDLEEIVGKDKVHDLHIWRLQSNCIIGTVHIRCNDLVDYITSSKAVKNLFHKSDIHCTTIQPEFDAQQNTSTTGSADFKGCVIKCGGDMKCNQEICCPTENANHHHSHHSLDNQAVATNV